MILLRLGRAKYNGIWKNRFEDMNRIDGMPTENMPKNHSQPEKFKDRIIFMYNDIEWKAKRNEEQCEYNSQTVANSARKFPRGPGSEEQWYGT